MQLKEKKSSMERDKRKLESELEKQRQTIGKQVFLQVVQKKNMGETGSPSPQTINPPIPAAIAHLDTGETAPRRQWDKSQKGFIDLENANSNNKPLTEQITTAKVASSVSSLSTPSSSTSHSPPNQRVNIVPASNGDEPRSVDLSKAYYSRDEMMKTIETLKTSTIALASSQRPSSSSVVKDIDTELQKANSKLSELQNEITRLTVLQQQQQTIHTHKSFSKAAKPTYLNTFNLNEEKSKQESQQSQQQQQQVDTPDTEVATPQSNGK